MFGVGAVVAIAGIVSGFAGVRKNSRRVFISGLVVLVAGFLCMVITRPPTVNLW